MPRTETFRPSGFTLLEIMLVIVVISILLAMIGASAYSARQRAYAATATAETQQIATAFKSYYLAHHEWPKDWKGGHSWLALDKNNLQPLLGGSGGTASSIWTSPTPGWREGISSTRGATPTRCRPTSS